MISRQRFSFAASALAIFFLVGCGQEFDATQQQNPISSGEARLGFQSKGDSGKEDPERDLAIAETDRLLAEIHATQKLADTAKKSLSRAKGGLLGVATSQGFGKTPNGVQIALANGFLITASRDVKKLGVSLDNLKKSSGVYDDKLKEIRAKSRIVSTLTSEVTVALLWGYNTDNQISYFNFIKMYEVERAEHEVEKIIRALRNLESQVSRTRENLVDPKK